MSRRVVLAPVVSRTGAPATRQLGLAPVRIERKVLKPKVRRVAAQTVVLPPVT